MLLTTFILKYPFIENDYLYIPMYATVVDIPTYIHT